MLPHKMPTEIRVILSGLVLLAVTACAVFDIHKPETFEENVTFVQSGVAEAQEGLKAQIARQAISKEDARDVDQQLDQAIEALDVTIAVRETDPARAENRLQAAKVIVGALKSLTEK